MVYSYLVVFASRTHTNALTENQLAYEQDGVFMLRLNETVGKMEDHTTWNALGLREVKGTAMLKSTDPAHSNSGNTFAAMLLTLWNGGVPPNSQQAAALLPRLFTFFRSHGVRADEHRQPF